MKKQYLFIALAVFFLGLIFLGFQYYKAFKVENVSAVTTGTPNPGHSWSEMECSSDTLCVDTINKRLGIGTNNPTKTVDIIGEVKVSGDVCNGTGKCLSSVYQTNVIAGTNPTCPTGQDIIMKAYNGTWYTAENPTITSWTKVSCGAVITNDGSPLLVYGNHTADNCTSAGGTVVTTGGSYDQCKFTAASCPSGWIQYLNWSTTAPATSSGAPAINCASCSCPACSGLSTGSHSWSNVARETATSSNFAATWALPSPHCEQCLCNGYGLGSAYTCTPDAQGSSYYVSYGSAAYATITTIGCY